MAWTPGLASLRWETIWAVTSNSPAELSPSKQSEQEGTDCLRAR